ncbi:MAG: hypothetical protein JSR18_05300 [Proteobacteria bacterium]|nr:hypothetical protein [Pseudomonadota bacterium]
MALAGPPPPPQPPRKRRLAALAENIGALFSILVSLVLIAAIVALVYAFVRELRRDTLDIDGISAPLELTQRGYTGPVIAGAILTELQKIQGAASTSHTRRALEADSAIPDIQVATSGLSMKSIVRYGRRLLGMPEHRIGGEILQDPPSLRLVLRVVEGANTQSVTVTRDDGNVDALLKEGGRALAQLADPYVLASYLHDQEKAQGTAFPQTLAAIDYVLSHPPASDDAWAYNLLGLIRTEQGEDAAAVKAYEHALALDPQLPVVGGNYASALARVGRADDAERFLAARAASARNLDDLRQLIMMHGGVGDFAGLVATTRAVLAQDPNDPAALMWRSIGLYYLHRNAEALHWADVGVQRVPRDHDIAINRGGMLLLNGKMDQGLAVLNAEYAQAKARDDREAMLTAQWLLAYAKYLQGDYATAARELQAAIDAGEPSTGAREIYGEALLRLGRPADAAVQFAAATQILPEGNAYTGVARAELAQGHVDQALTALALASRFDKDNVLMYETWAQALDKAGKPQQAAAKRAEIPLAEARLKVPLPD